MAESVLACTSEQGEPATSTAIAPRWRPRLLLLGLMLAALVMLVAECLHIFVGSNFHCVVRGHCYRAGQPTVAFLVSTQRTHGIKTILNLRDENEEEEWYRQEKQAAQRLGLVLANAGLSSVEQPPEEDFHKLIEALKSCPEPILIHCANGNDRTGLAAALYLLMRTDTPLPSARGQLSLRYGHFAFTRSSCLHRMLDSYEAWLQHEHQDHSPDHLYYWGMNVYRPESNPALCITGTCK